jgi:hypothetical protein
MQQFHMKVFNDADITRYNSTSGTLIDLIFGPSLLDDYFCFVRPNNFSDHESVFLQLNIAEREQQDLVRYERSFSERELQRFDDYLSAQDWFSVAVADSVNDKCREFMRIFLLGFEMCFPVRKRLYRANQIGKIPVSPSIKLQRSQLFDLRCLIRVTDDAAIRANLKKQEKAKKFVYLKQLEKEVKARHNDVIQKASNKTKAAWSLINDGISAGARTVRPVRLMHNGVLVENVADVVEVFNNSFVISQPPNVQYDGGHISHLRVEKSMFLTPVGVQEIVHFAKRMPSKKSCGYDGVPMFLAKKVAPLVAAPMADICCASFAQGLYPDPFKPGVVVPVFKKGDCMDAGNYRPISNLPAFSKILENCFLVRLLTFFEDNKLLPASQHGFLKGRGTQTALFEFMNNLFKSFEKRQKVLSIFYDLSNAFGTVCTPILLHKFELLGVRGVALNWLTSALSGRTQCVKLQDIVDGKFQKDVFSSFLPVTRGTPQGGIISPFSFDIGIFYMALYVLIGILLNYADDSSSMVAAPTSARLYCEARMAAGLMYDYCVSNFLTLNAAKSVIICFRAGRTPLLDHSPYVPIAGRTVQCSRSTKFLGLFICDDLSWHEHGAYVIGKLNTAVFMISSLMKRLDQKYLLMVYYAYAYSFMQYGINFWGCSAAVMKAVFVAQKRLVRALAGERYWPADSPLCSARPLFDKLNLLPIYSLYLLEACKFIRQHPQYFRSAGDVHEHATRSRDNIYVERYSFKSPYVCMSFVYNSLPDAVKGEKNFRKYVKLLREFVYSKKFYCEEEFLCK